MKLFGTKELRSRLLLIDIHNILGVSRSIWRVWQSTNLYDALEWVLPWEHLHIGASLA